MLLERSKKEVTSVFFIIVMFIFGLILGYNYISTQANRNIMNALGTDKIPKVLNIYQSERGFGNDHYDIYRFELSNTEKNLRGSLINSQYNGDSKRFKDMFHQNEMHLDNADKIKQQIKAIESNKESIYIYQNNEESMFYKLVLYNPSKNIGFYFDLAL